MIEVIEYWITLIKKQTLIVCSGFASVSLSPDVTNATVTADTSSLVTLSVLNT